MATLMHYRGWQLIYFNTLLGGGAHKNSSPNSKDKKIYNSTKLNDFPVFKLSADFRCILLFYIILHNCSFMPCKRDNSSLNEINSLSCISVTGHAILVTWRGVKGWGQGNNPPMISVFFFCLACQLRGQSCTSVIPKKNVSEPPPPPRVFFFRTGDSF